MAFMTAMALGARISVTAGNSMSVLRKLGGGLDMVRSKSQSLANGFVMAAGGLGRIGAAGLGVTAMLGGIVAHSSSLAANLEAQQLTMRVMVGDADKAQGLMDEIIKKASSTPFEQGDLIEGSKRLLRLTGDNVDMNLELLDLVSTMAALDPTKNVTDAVEAVLDATSGGGFERLKEFGLSLRADEFKKSGKPGGKAWADAVIDTVKTTMDQRTNGEDIVAALSETTMGRFSTLKDNVNLLFLGIGEIMQDNVKDGLVDIIALLGEVNKGLRGDGATAAAEFGKGIAFATKTAVEGINQIKAFMKPLIGDFAEGNQQLAFWAGAFIVFGTLAVAALTPVVLGLAAVLAVGAMLGELLIPVLLVIAGVAALAGAGIAAMFISAEMHGLTVIELFQKMLAAQVEAFRVGAAQFMTWITPIKDQLNPAIEEIKQLWIEVVALFTSTQPRTNATWQEIAQGIGNVIGFFALLLAGAIRVFATITRIAGGFIIAFARPFLTAQAEVAGGFMDILSGGANMRTGLIRIFTGLKAMMLAPFKGAISVIMEQMKMLATSPLGAKLLGAAGFDPEKISKGITDLQVKLADTKTGTGAENFTRGSTLAEQVLNKMNNVDTGRQMGPTRTEVTIDDKRSINIDNKLEIEGREVAIAGKRHEMELADRAGFRVSAWQTRRILEQGAALVANN